MYQINNNTFLPPPNVVYVPVPVAPPRPNVSSTISFTLNGSQVTVTNPDPLMSLNDFIRSKGLTGTKIMCAEGGCGSCTVMMESTNHPSGTPVQRAINSCLRPLCSVDGSSITTTEGIGSQATGYHPIQEQIADNNGSQCGYCTPGMVMSMYSLLVSNPSPTVQDVEDNFDGNLCRCTGYRPILSAFKTFATNGSVEQHSCKGESCCAKHFFPDIEDLKIGKPKQIEAKHIKHGKCTKPNFTKKPLCVQADTTVWVTPPDLPTLVNLVFQYANTNTPYKLVVGNTSSGVFKNQNYNIFIDITKVPDLTQISLGPTGFEIGSAITLTDLLVLFQNWINEPSLSGKTGLLPQLITHLKRVANHQVRNVASWAGNIMMAHDNVDFPSDVFTIFAAAGATLTVVNAKGQTTGIDLISFLNVSMAGSVILNINIPYSVANQKFNTFKVALRHQNAHALVNSGYNVILDSNSNFTSQTIIVYGGIGPHALRMPQTEQYLVGKNISDVTALQGALKVLSQEAYPDPGPIGKQAYRYSLLTSLFYKFWLSLLPPSSLNPILLSAAQPYVRPISNGVQSYQTNPAEFPVSAPIPKLTAATQASGEVQYAGDIPPPQNTLYGTLVTATIGSGTIASIDPTAALQSTGVTNFLTAKDVPGKNTWNGSQEIFASTTIYHYGQPIGLIIADTQQHADAAALLVVVNYTNIQTPILTIDDAIAKNSFQGTSTPITVGNVTQGFAQSDQILSGTINVGAQYYFFMETHTTLVVPNENGLTVYATTQGATSVQSAVCTATNLAQGSVNVIVGSVGGGYGGKGAPSPLVPAAAAIASQVVKQPIKMRMTLQDCMQSVGHRPPVRADYKVGFMNNGKVQALQVTWYLDSGFTAGAIFIQSMAMTATDNNYYFPNAQVTGQIVKTNLPTNATMRGPGRKEGVLVCEEIMWNVAKFLNMDPQDVKELNFFKDGQTTISGQKLLYYNLPTMWNVIKVSSDFAARQQAVAQFNKANRWMKKGIAIANTRYGINYAHAQYGVIVSISAADGQVTVTHSGCEIGQGISTKVAQVVAYELAVPLSIITVTQTSTATIPNTAGTSASHTSSLNCLAAIQACQILVQQLAPVKAALPPNSTWQQLIAKAASQGIDLQAKGWTNQPNNPNGPDTYEACAVACVEVQIDVLTGETQIIRADMLFDAGISLNPAIDLGQAEGGFVQGYGNILSEELDYDPTTGQLITNGTWEYKPPSSQDIPIDYRVTILKNAPNPYGVLSSKATGEPPLVSSCGVLLAVKDAIENARSAAGITTSFDLDAPCTVDKIQTWCQTNITQYTF